MGDYRALIAVVLELVLALGLWMTALVRSQRWRCPTRRRFLWTKSSRQPAAAAAVAGQVPGPQEEARVLLLLQGHPLLQLRLLRRRQWGTSGRVLTSSLLLLEQEQAQQEQRQGQACQRVPRAARLPARRVLLQPMLTMTMTMVQRPAEGGLQLQLLRLRLLHLRQRPPALPQSRRSQNPAGLLHLPMAA